MAGSIKKSKLLAGLITATLATGSVGSAVYAGSLFGFGAKNEETPEVQLAQIETKDIENTINLTGALASASERTASVNSKAAELAVKEIKVKVGDEVKAGDVLYTLDTEDLEIALSQAEKSLAVIERKNEIAAKQEKRNLNFTEYSQNLAETQEVRSIWLAEDQLNDNYVDEALAYDDLYKKYGVEDQSYYDAVNAQLAMYDLEDEVNAALEDPCVSVEELNVIIDEYNSAVTAFNTSVTAYETAVSTSIGQEAAVRTANRTVRNAEKELIDKRENLDKNNRERDNTLKKEKDAIETSSLDRSTNGFETKNTIKKLRDQIAASVVTASNTGVVTAVNANVGSAAGNEPVVITDVNSYNLSCDVDEQFIADIKDGMDVRFTTNATGEDMLNGTVTFTAVTPTKQQNSNNNNGNDGNSNTSTSGSTDKSRGSYRVIIRVNDKNDRLRPGMSAKITIITAKADDVLAVPNECISNNNNGESILTVTTDGGATTQEVVVTTGLSDGSYTEVSGTGLSEGTQLVVPQMAQVEEDFDLF